VFVPSKKKKELVFAKPEKGKRLDQKKVFVSQNMWMWLTKIPLF